jgi:hypothetical protein
MLPMDICRCHNEDCPLRQECARFVFRFDTKLGTSHTTYEPDDEGCAHYAALTERERCEHQPGGVNGEYGHKASTKRHPGAGE